MSHRTLVTILVYNEAAKLQRLLADFPDNPDYDLLAVDDGSTDGTNEVLAATGIEIIRHEQNLGVGTGIREAIQHGREQGYDFIVIMAGNGKMRPSEIPRLLEPLSNGSADYVQGSRYLSGGESPNLPGGRGMAIKGLTLIARLLLGYRATDVTCGFRAYRLNLFDDPRFRIDQDWLNRYELEYYIHFHVVKGGYRLAEVPVAMVYPREKKNYSKIRPITGWWSILRPWVFLTLRLKR